MYNKDLKILKEGEIGTGILIENDYSIALSTESLIKEDFDRKSYLSKPFLIKCILQKSDTRNRNGRIYPKKVLQKEIEKYNTIIKDGGAVGELDHPDATNISGKNISHSVKRTWWDGDTVWGELELHISPGYLESGICSRPADYVFDDLRRGVKYGISSRGVGSVREVNGDTIVDEDFELICFDLVLTPSTPGAYLFTSSNMNEGKIAENKSNSNLISALDNFLIKNK